jgi:hypothetical protein
MVSGRYFSPKAPLLCLKWIPACAETSVNVIGPDGRAGSEVDADVDTGVDSFEVSVEDSLAGGGADFDLQPTIETMNVTRQKAMHDSSLVREFLCAVLK